MCRALDDCGSYTQEAYPPHRSACVIFCCPPLPSSQSLQGKLTSIRILKVFPHWSLHSPCQASFSNFSDEETEANSTEFLALLY